MTSHSRQYRHPGGLQLFSWRIEPEAFIWFSGLLFLACINPAAGSHYSFCVFKLLGISWCPGCGLGRAVSLALHGELRASLAAHPLGIVSFVILAARICTLQFRSNYHIH